jgi:hypothetical protein
VPKLSIPTNPVRCIADGERIAEHRQPEEARPMQYALLIYSEPPQSEPSPEQMKQVTDAYNVFTKALVDGGAMRGGEALQDGKTATTVRNRDGKTLVTDGPFAETKEEFGGYYIVEAASLDEALKWAAQCPGANWGSIEVRPVWETTGGMDAAGPGMDATRPAVGATA